MCWVNVLWKTYSFNKWNILLGQIKGITGRELAKKMFQYHEQCLKRLCNNAVINCHSRGMWPILHYMWEATLGSDCGLVVSFSEMLTFYLRKKKKRRQDTHQYHMSLLSSQCHIHRSHPHRPHCCISHGHKCMLWERWGKPLSLAVCAARTAGVAQTSPADGTLCSRLFEERCCLVPFGF